MTRANGLLQIEAQGVSRLDLVRRLAELTQTELHLAPGALAESAQQSFRWQGHDLAEAWQGLLGAAQPHAVQCAGRQCRVWVLAAQAGHASKAGDAEAAQALSAYSPPLQPDPPGLFPSD